MDSQLKRTAYRLKQEIGHLKFFDVTNSAEIIPFSGSDEMLGLSRTHSYAVPQTVFFSGNQEAILVSDYLVANNDWPIFSKKAYEILLSLGEFLHKKIDICMTETRDANLYNIPPDEARKLCFSNDYVAVHLLEHLDVFDYEHSRYKEKSEYNPKRVNYVSEYVFKDLFEDLPPMFKIYASPEETFVSSKVRKAFKENGIAGPAYQPLIMKEYTLEVDVPIPLPELAHGIN